MSPILAQHLPGGQLPAGVLDTGVTSPSSDITATANDVAWVKWGEWLEDTYF
jgi:hypothetical protein